MPAALPADWVQWLERIEDPDFSNALEVARRGKDEWPISYRETDPVAVERLVRQLERVQSVPIAVDRASDALPLLVAWLRRDPEYPRETMASVYSTLLTLFALGTRRGRGIFEFSGLLVSALLSIGMSDKAYRGLLGDIDELLGSGLGIDSLYWLLDVLEDTIRSPAPDVGARYEFWNTALAKIQPLREQAKHTAARFRCSFGCRLGMAGRSTGVDLIRDGCRQLSRRTQRAKHRDLYANRVGQPDKQRLNSRRFHRR